eukprot:8567969-Alexandrium_andersonii.AAC.1
MLARSLRAGPLLVGDQPEADRRSLGQMLDEWGPSQGPEAGRGVLGKLAARATGWQGLAPGAR